MSVHLISEAIFHDVSLRFTPSFYFMGTFVVFNYLRVYLIMEFE